MSREITVKERIYKVLMENSNGYLSHEQIAEISYGVAYLRDTKKNLNGLIKRNIVYAIGELNRDGYVVIKDLAPTANGKKLTHKKVLGYKIADLEDIHEVKKNLKNRNQRLEIASEQKLFFEGLAQDNKLLT